MSRAEFNYPDAHLFKPERWQRKTSGGGVGSAGGGSEGGAAGLSDALPFSVGE